MKIVCIGIRSPKNATGNLPVIFWIHGGGNSIQWPLLSRHDGGFLANKGNMVVVTASYRLGPMGFFNHPALKTGDEAGDSGNFVILDLIAALKWVQTNIKNFGGNPGTSQLPVNRQEQRMFSLWLFRRWRKVYSIGPYRKAALLKLTTPAQGAEHINGIIAKLLVKDGKGRR